MKRSLGIKLGDILLIAVILLSAVALSILPFFATRSDTAEIVVAQTNEVLRIPLNKDADYKIVSRGIRLTACVRDGEIFVSDADCRDGICQSTRPISRAGQSIVCLPAGVVIRVLGEGGEVDGVSG